MRNRWRVGISIKNIFLHVLPVLQLKLEELYTLYNYQEITIEELWDYCLKYKFENNPIEKQPIHRIVKVIFNVSVLEIKDYKKVLDDCSQSHRVLDDCSQSQHVKLTEEEVNFLLGSSHSI